MEWPKPWILMNSMDGLGQLMLFYTTSICTEKDIFNIEFYASRKRIIITMCRLHGKTSVNYKYKQNHRDNNLFNITSETFSYNLPRSKIEKLQRDIPGVKSRKDTARSGKISLNKLGYIRMSCQRLTNVLINVWKWPLRPPIHHMRNTRDNILIILCKFLYNVFNYMYAVLIFDFYIFLYICSNFKFSVS